MSDMSRVQREMEAWVERNRIEQQRASSAGDAGTAALRASLAETESQLKGARGECRRLRSELLQRDGEVRASSTAAGVQAKKYKTAIRLLDQMHGIVRDARESERERVERAKSQDAEVETLRKHKSSTDRKAKRAVRDANAAQARASRLRVSAQQFRREATEKNRALVRQNRFFRGRIRDLEVSLYGRSITLPLHKAPDFINISAKFRAALTPARSRAAAASVSGSKSARLHRKAKKITTRSAAWK